VDIFGEAVAQTLVCFPRFVVPQLRNRKNKHHHAKTQRPQSRTACFFFVLLGLCALASGGCVRETEPDEAEPARGGIDRFKRRVPQAQSSLRDSPVLPGDNPSTTGVPQGRLNL